MISEEESREALEEWMETHYGPDRVPRYDTIRGYAWRACLAWAEQRIREDERILERERLAKLAESRNLVSKSTGFLIDDILVDGCLGAAEIRAGKLEE